MILIFYGDLQGMGPPSQQAPSIIFLMSYLNPKDFPWKKTKVNLETRTWTSHFLTEHEPYKDPGKYAKKKQETLLNTGRNRSNSIYKAIFMGYRL